MEKGGQEQELRMLHLKPAFAFADAAFAQDNDLLAAPQRIDDDSPFFECGPHPGSLGTISAFCNARTVAEAVISNQCSVNSKQQTVIGHP
jgi:hypothetical protein